MTAEPAWLDYAVRWRTGEARPGRHRARQTGTGGALQGYRPFWQAPDARRIDVRRSIMDPAGELMVRQMENRGSITVIVAADLSRSMHANFSSPKLEAVTALVHAASRTAHRAGDAFGFVGFDDAIREDLAAHPTRARGPAIETLEKLRRFVPQGRSASGLVHIAARLPARRALILLVSDFLLPGDLLQAALESLATHDVVPIVLRDAAESALPPYGLVRLRDSETGRQKLLLMRPALQAFLMQEAQAWRSRLDAMFLRYCRPAFHAAHGLDIAALGQHLLQC